MVDPANTRLDHQITSVTNRSPNFTEPSISLEFENESDSTAEESSLAYLYDSSHINQTPQDFEREITSRKKQSTARFKSKWEEILSKYSQINDEKESDEIDLFTGEIIIDNGHLKSLISDNTRMRGIPVQHNIWSGSDIIERDLLKTKEWKNVRAKRELKEKLKKDHKFHFQNTSSHGSDTPTRQTEIPEDNLILVKPSPTKKSRKSSPVKKQKVSPIGKINFFQPGELSDNLSWRKVSQNSKIKDDSPSKIAFNTLSLNTSSPNVSPTKGSRLPWRPVDNTQGLQDSSVIVGDDSASELEDFRSSNIQDTSSDQVSDESETHEEDVDDNDVSEESASSVGFGYPETFRSFENDVNHTETAKIDEGYTIKGDRNEVEEPSHDHDEKDNIPDNVFKDNVACVKNNFNEGNYTPTNEHHQLQSTILKELAQELESEAKSDHSGILPKPDDTKENINVAQEPHRNLPHFLMARLTKKEGAYPTLRSHHEFSEQIDKRQSNSQTLIKVENDKHETQDWTALDKALYQNDRRVAYDEGALINVDISGLISYIANDQAKATERYRCTFPRCTYMDRGELKYRRHLLRFHRHELRLIGYPVRVESPKPKQLHIPEVAIINLLKVFPLVHNLPDPHCVINPQEVNNKLFTCPVLGCKYSTSWGYNGMKEHFEITQHHIQPSLRSISRPFSRSPTKSPPLKVSAKLPEYDSDSFSKPKPYSKSNDLQKEIDDMFSGDENESETADFSD